MNSEKKTTSQPVSDATQEKETRFQVGEKGFAFFLLFIGLFFTWQSWLLYQEHPGASSCGSVPLFCSSLITLFSLITIITDWSKKSANAGKAIGKMIADTWNYLFPLDVIVMILFMIVYCAALYMGLGFMLVTPIFLWGSMSFLSRGNYVRNLLWTILCMLFIYLVFHVLFSVVLP